ncbi:MAG: SoxR reducing system RseC family protein [Candidatus Latescibacteria bacterium]|nr:SoxR reducing system RseC family protein [Candidatus Latescibacterota bacterium]
MNGMGIVVDVAGAKAKVRVNAGAECMGCPSKSFCHGSEMKLRDIMVMNDPGAHVSDRVVFESEPGKVLFLAVVIWIVPILSMIAGYVIADRFVSGFWPIAGAFVFLACSFVALKLVDSAVTGGTSFYPKITLIVDQNTAADEVCGGMD